MWRWLPHCAPDSSPLLASLKAGGVALWLGGFSRSFDLERKRISLLDEVVHAIALRRCDVLPLAPSEPVPLVVGPGGVGIVVAELSPHPLVTAEDEAFRG